MLFEIANDFIIQCNVCGKNIEINKHSLEIDYTSYEREMGTEILYSFSGETVCCCGNRLIYVITAVEYPLNAYNTHYNHSNGCSFKTIPDIAIVYVPRTVLTVFEQILRDPNYIFSLEPQEFESLVADLFNQYGFNALVTQKTRDGGKDIIATFEMGGIIYTTYFECKQQSFNRPVGVDVVRELYGVMQKDNIDKGIIVTTSRFTKDAEREAEELKGRIQLIDFVKLCDLMRKL